MKHRRHLTRDELNNQFRIDAIVKQAYREERERLPLDGQVVTAIKATHTADLTMQAIVLVDHFHADREWVLNFLDLQKELLEQYDAGTVQLKQMQEHLKLTVGVDIEAYTDEIMEFAGIDKKKEATDERKTVPEPDQTP